MGSKDDLARQAWAATTSVFFGDEMHDRFHDAAQAAGLPHPGALKALLTLDTGQPTSMRAIAAGMRCDASYITALVDILEHAGCVERRVSPDDRRVKLVHMTDHGRTARLHAEEVLTTPPDGLHRLTTDELRTLQRIMTKVAGSSAAATA